MGHLFILSSAKNIQAKAANWHNFYQKFVFYIYLDITEEDAMSFRLGILDGADYTSTAVGTLIRCTFIPPWNKDDILSCLWQRRHSFLAWKEKTEQTVGRACYYPTYNGRSDDFSDCVLTNFLSIRYEFSVRYQAAKLSTPKVRL